MNKFPEDFDRDSIQKELERNLNLLYCDFLKTFKSKIDEAIKNCETSINLIFDNNISSVHKEKICKEYIDKFGKIIVITNSNHIYQLSVKNTSIDLQNGFDEIKQIQLEI